MERFKAERMVQVLQSLLFGIAAGVVVIEDEQDHPAVDSPKKSRETANFSPPNRKTEKPFTQTPNGKASRRQMLRTHPSGKRGKN